MANINNYTPEEIKELIIEDLKEAGIETDLLKITVESSLKVSVSGEVPSIRERNITVQTILDIVGVDEIEDNLEIIGERSGDPEKDDEGDENNYDLYDDDNESMGTEDIIKAMEDGVPYIPPTTSSFEEDTGKPRKRKKYGNW